MRRWLWLICCAGLPVWAAQPPAADRQLAVDLAEHGDPAGAAVEFRRLALGADQGRERAGFYWAAAFAYTQSGQWAVSEKMLDRAEDADPELGAPALLLRAENAARQAQWTEAGFFGQSVLATATKRWPDVLVAVSNCRQWHGDPHLRRAASLQEAVWGQGFAAPVFSEELEVVHQRLVGERHLKLQLRHQGELVDAIWFGRSKPLPARATLAYRLDVNEWRGQQTVQLVVEGMAD